MIAFGCECVGKSKSTAAVPSTLAANVARDYFQVSFRITSGATWSAALADSTTAAYSALVAQVFTYV